MDVRPIDEFLEREPFIPFRIKFSNGDAVDIRNPELVVTMKRDIFIAEPSRDRFHVYALIHVVGLETLSNGHPGRRRPGRRRGR
jgi:hypothetical protein